MIWYVRVILSNGVRITSRHRDPDCFYLNRPAPKNDTEILRLPATSGIARLIPDCTECCSIPVVAPVRMRPEDALRRRTR